jgi:hypothetical protein
MVVRTIQFPNQSLHSNSFFSWGTYIDEAWPLKDDRREYQPDADYLRTRPTITPKSCEPLWWSSPISDEEVSIRRREYLSGALASGSAHANEWIRDEALVGKTMLFHMTNSKAKNSKQVACYTVWHAGYVKPIIVRHGQQQGKWVALDGFKAIHPNPQSKSHQQPWLIIRGSDGLRGRYCKAVQFHTKERVYSVRLLDYEGGKFYDGGVTAPNIRIEDLNIAWVDQCFKEGLRQLDFYVHQGDNDVWSSQLDLPGAGPN